MCSGHAGRSPILCCFSLARCRKERLWSHADRPQGSWKLVLSHVPRPLDLGCAPWPPRLSRSPTRDAVSRRTELACCTQRLSYGGSVLDTQNDPKIPNIKFQNGANPYMCTRPRYKYAPSHDWSSAISPRLSWPHQPQLEHESHPSRPCLSPSFVGDEPSAISRARNADGTPSTSSVSGAGPHPLQVSYPLRQEGPMWILHQTWLRDPMSQWSAIYSPSPILPFANDPEQALSPQGKEHGNYITLNPDLPPTHSVDSFYPTHKSSMSIFSR